MLKWHYFSKYIIEPIIKDMRVKQLVASIAALMIVFSIQAQRAILMGTIDNPASELVKVNYESNLLDGSDISFEADLDDKNGYIFVLPVDGITIVNLYYNKKNIKLLIKPGNQLTFDFDASGFENNTRFRGDGAGDNELYHAFNKEFKLLSHQYKSVFFADYPIPERVLNKMKSAGPKEFQSFAKANLQNEVNFLLQGLETYNPAVDVADYLQNMIEYKWALLQLSYPDVNKSGFTIEDSYFDFLQSVNLANEQAVGMKEYMCFLDLFMEHLYIDAMKKQGLEGGTFEEKFYLIERFFQGPTRDYALAQLLMRTVNRNNFGQIAHLFDRYTSIASTEKPLTTIQTAIRRLNQFREGTMAPEFQLTDAFGTPRRLSEYRGKMVYLSFWAGWCKPCIAEITNSRDNRLALSNSDIVFLFVSVDRSLEKWNSASDRNALDGVNLWAGDGKSGVERDYEVTSLPRYFLIDRNGRFINNFPKASEAGFVDRIRGMM